MDLLSLLAKTVADRFIQRIAHRTVESVIPPPDGTKWSTKRIDKVLTKQRILDAAQRHIVEANNRASLIQFFGMSAPELTESISLPLDLSAIPRKFRSPDMAGVFRGVLQERDLLQDTRHYILLGDPGAGKTTTVKRLVKTLLTQPSTSNDDIWNFPILLILRDYDHTFALADLLIEELGLGKYVSELLRHELIDKKEVSREDLEDTIFGAARLRLEMAAFILDNLGAVVFLDGIDEVPEQARRYLEMQITSLSGKLSNAKLIVSCRSGDYVREMEGFSAVEICELTLRQIRNISNIWLGETRGNEFIDEITRGSAIELADRPLFLCQMLTLYRNTGRVPDHPWSLCRQMVRLTLQDWDYHRRVIRGSRYSQFDTDAKFDFLCNLAYSLTYVSRAKRFQHDDLVRVYNSISNRFGLPSNEAQQVAAEIETHTGIIVEVGFRGYEFSHLSIQEYLAAEYIVKLPDRSILGKLLEQSPGTVAVAAALSSDPARFMVVFASTGTNIQSFLTRLLQEKPRFREDVYLGLLGLQLALREPHALSIELLVSFLSQPGVTQSVARLLSDTYQIRREKTFDRRHGATIRRKAIQYDIPGAELPEEGYLSSEALGYLWRACPEYLGKIDSLDSSQSKDANTVGKLGMVGAELNDSALSAYEQGMLLQSSGQLADAREYYQKALEMWTVLGDVASAATAFAALGDIARLSSRPAAAESYYRSAIDCFERTHDESGYANSTLRLGSLLTDQGRVVEAVRCVATSLDKAHAAEGRWNIEGLQLLKSQSRMLDRMSFEMAVQTCVRGGVYEELMERLQLTMEPPGTAI